MNCKPSDIAIIIKSFKPVYIGKLVEVMYAPPDAPFILPDGMPHCRPNRNPSWVVRSLCGPLPCPCKGDPAFRMALYGVAADECLRPLRGDPDVVAIEHEACTT